MSKLQRLRDNIAAIEEALNGGNNQEVLAKYSGFGGLGFILNGILKSGWNKSDLQYYEDTMRLRQMLVDNSKDERDRYMQQVCEDDFESCMIYAGKLAEMEGDER